MRMTRTAARRSMFAMFAALIAFPTAHAHADQVGDVVTPGMAIFKDTSRTSYNTCTLGFIARDGADSPVALTAGHCAENSEAHPWVSLYHYSAQDYEQFAYYQRVYMPDQSDLNASDIGELGLDQATLPIDARVAGKWRVAGVVDGDYLTRNPPEHMYYYGTNHGLREVQFDYVTGNKVYFHGAVEHGESGSAIFMPSTDGRSVFAIGIVDAVEAGNESVAVGELVAPWVKAWGLRLS